eukprot:TCONS_00019718-protein
MAATPVEEWEEYKNLSPEDIEEFQVLIELHNLTKAHTERLDAKHAEVERLMRDLKKFRKQRDETIQALRDTYDAKYAALQNKVEEADTIREELRTTHYELRICLLHLKENPSRNQSETETESESESDSDDVSESVFESSRSSFNDANDEEEESVSPSPENVPDLQRQDDKFINVQGSEKCISTDRPEEPFLPEVPLTEKEIEEEDERLTNQAVAAQ